MDAAPHKRARCEQADESWVRAVTGVVRTVHPVRELASLVVALLLVRIVESVEDGLRLRFRLMPPPVQRVSKALLFKLLSWGAWNVGAQTLHGYGTASYMLIVLVPSNGCPD